MNHIYNTSIAGPGIWFILIRVGTELNWSAISSSILQGISGSVKMPSNELKSRYRMEFFLTNEWHSTRSQLKSRGDDYTVLSLKWNRW